MVNKAPLCVHNTVIPEHKVTYMVSHPHNIINQLLIFIAWVPMINHEVEVRYTSNIN